MTESGDCTDLTLEIPSTGEVYADILPQWKVSELKPRCRFGVSAAVARDLVHFTQIGAEWFFRCLSVTDGAGLSNVE